MFAFPTKAVPMSKDPSNPFAALNARDFPSRNERGNPQKARAKAPGGKTVVKDKAAAKAEAEAELDADAEMFMNALGGGFRSLPPKESTPAKTPAKAKKAPAGKAASPAQAKPVPAKPALSAAEADKAAFVFTEADPQIDPNNPFAKALKSESVKRMVQKNAPAPAPVQEEPAAPAEEDDAPSTLTGMARAAARIGRCLEDSALLLSTLLVGNTLVNFAIATLGYRFFEACFPGRGAVFAIPVMTVALLMFGEITPKQIALRRTEALAPLCARLLLFWRTALTPCNLVLRSVSRAFSGALERERRALSDTELISVLDAATERGEFSGRDAEMVEGVLRLSELQANDEMTPRVDMEFYDLDLAVETLGRVHHHGLGRLETLAGVQLPAEALGIDAGHQAHAGCRRRDLRPHNGKNRRCAFRSRNGHARRSSRDVPPQRQRPRNRAR